MRYKEIGKSGIKASVVGFGAWAVGGWMWGGTEEEASVEAIKAAVAAGINFIDTAPVYGFGLSEEIVGKAIKGIRDKVVIATKCGLVWDKEEGVFHFQSDEKAVRQGRGDINVFRYLSPISIRTEIERSLRRIKTDYIDLYQTHWQDSTTPIEDTMNELLKLKAEGKIRAIGVSNATTEHLEEYRKTGELDADQESYSMLDRKKERDNIPYCQRHGISFIAYSPLARGLLTGKVSMDFVFDDGDHRRDNPLFSRENRIKTSDLLDKLSIFTERYNITPAQMAIAWAFQQEGCTHALVGARNPQQAVENAKAGELVFSPEEMMEINKIVDNYYK